MSDTTDDMEWGIGALEATLGSEDECQCDALRARVAKLEKALKEIKDTTEGLIGIGNPNGGWLVAQIKEALKDE